MAAWEGLMVALAVAHAAILFQMPAAPVIAVALWWNANTISHNFIHRPFFRSRGVRRIFAAYLSVLLGFPHALWRDRHLAHHAGVAFRLRVSRQLILQTLLVLALWIAMAAAAPRFFLSVYLPGYFAGLGLCALHGYYEHVRGATSHYGTLYNLLFFNDGYHVEHHANSAIHWTRLPDHLDPAASTSAWPAPLRWMEAFSLDGMERLVLRSPALQRFVLAAHAAAFSRLAGALPPITRVTIVGGGIFPRTALIIQRLLPGAQVTILDGNRANLDQARRFLAQVEVGRVSNPLAGLQPALSPVKNRLAGYNPAPLFVHGHYTPSRPGAMRPARDSALVRRRPTRPLRTASGARGHRA